MLTVCFSQKKKKPTENQRVVIQKRRKRLHSITYVNVYLHIQKTSKYLIINNLRIQTTMFVLL